MEHSNQLIKQSVREIEALSKTSQTEAGPTKQSITERQDSINQIFALFRINYHNQYHAAFNDTEVLNQAKRLWFDSLQYFSAGQLLRAARQVIEESEYLPSLQRMLRACEDQLESIGLPNVHTAYLEACRAPSPKITYNWSHPAVYFAGLNSGWHLLTTESEKVSFPVFARHYRQQIRLVTAGEKLTIETPALIEENSGKPLSREETRTQLASLKAMLNEPRQ